MDIHELIPRREREARERDDPRERRRRAIVRAATELFVRQGYRKTSIAEVAEAAGVAKGTVYLYVQTKADLMVQALTDEVARYLDELEPALRAGQTPREQLELWLRSAMVINTQMPLVSRLIGGDREIVTVLEEMDSSVRESAAELQLRFVIHMLDQAARPHRWTASELRDRARVLNGLLYSSAFFAQSWILNDLTIERFSELLADMLVNGIAAERPSAEPPAVPPAADPS